MKTIETINNPYIKKLLELKKRKNIYRREEFLIEGRNNIEAAIKHHSLIALLVTEEIFFPEFENRILVPQMVIDKLKQTTTNYQMIGISKFPPTFEVDGFNKEWKNILVLDKINNPGNLGSAIRSAVAFDMDAVIILNDSVDVFNQKNIFATQGALFSIPIIKVTDWESYKNKLTHYSFSLFLLNNSSNSLTKTKFNSEFNALVFGNEAKGISKQNYFGLKTNSVYININSKIESLNISNAAAIGMFYFNWEKNNKN